MANNNNLFNAVIAGAGGGNQQRWLTAVDSGDYADYQSLIEQLATAIDGAIEPIVGDANIAQTALMQSITAAVFADRLVTSAQQANYEPIINSIIALYSSLDGVLLPPTGGGGGGTIVPLSIEVWVDPTTTVAPASQDGSIGAPFDSISDALDYLQTQKATIPAVGTVYLGNGDYAGETIDWPVVDADGTAAQNSLVLIGQGGVFNIGNINLNGTEEGENAPIIIIRDIGMDSLVEEGLGIDSISMPGEGGICTLQLVNCRVQNGINNVADFQTIKLIRSYVGGSTSLASAEVIDSTILNITGMTGTNSFRDSTIGDIDLQDENVVVKSFNTRFIGTTCRLQGSLSSEYRNCQMDFNTGIIGHGTFTNCSGFGSEPLSISGQPTFDACTFAVSEINGTAIDTYINMYGCRTNGAEGSAISSPSLRMEQCEWGGSLSIDTELQMDLSSYQTILKGGHLISGASTFNLTDVPDPQQSNTWDGDEPVVLTLLPLGHKPGIYLISASIYSHATDTAEISGSVAWSQPLAGAETFAFGTADASGGGGMLFSGTCAIQSDGTADITWTVSATGVGENLDVDINASCLIQGAI